MALFELVSRSSDKPRLSEIYLPLSVLEKIIQNFIALKLKTQSPEKGKFFLRLPIDNDFAKDSSNERFNHDAMRSLIQSRQNR